MDAAFGGSDSRYAGQFHRKARRALGPEAAYFQGMISMMPWNDPRSRWQAVQSRSREADGAFVFAVRTTGVYCRPSCPARRPLRQNVSFYPVPEAAEAAGFRSCLRCVPGRVRSADPAVEKVRAVCRHIDAHSDQSPSLEELSAVAGLSPHHFHRTFRRIVGITPREYADARRFGALKKRLKKGDPVTEATYAVGYGSSSRVYERTPSHLGMTPSAYGAGGSGMRLSYAVVDSPLGRLLVAATERGISAVCVGGSERSLVASLRDEYPNAAIDAESRTIADWTKAVVALASGQAPHGELPVDIQVTAFEWKVLQELRRIPVGETRSYSDVARRIGRPTAVRAVARACAGNPVAVVIPCHRVVGKNGSLTGYRWGVERKRALLEAEGQVSKG